MSEWKISRDEVLKLIKRYKHFECLWNLRIANYKRSDLKRKAWLVLSKHFERDVSEVKKKIKHLRCVYVTEKKKVDDSKKSGASADMIYQPRLFYYDDFNFLDSVIVLRKTTNNKYESDFVGGKAEEITECVSEEQNSSVYVEEMSLPYPSRLQSSWPSSSSITISSDLSQKKPRKISQSSSKVDDSVNIDNGYQKSATEKDIYSAFGKTIALQLSQLTPLEATSAMAQIHHLLSRRILKSMVSRNRRLSLQKRQSKKRK